jgi:integrase
MAVLTDAKARAIKPEGKDLPDGTVMGLWLKPTAKKGRGQWNFRYVSPITKKRRDMGLGAYPDVSIVEARRQANAARGEIRRKQDPIDQRKAAGEVAGSAMTFEQAALKMFDQIRAGWKNPKHAQQWINTLKTYVFPMIGSVTVDALQPDDFRKVLAPIWLKKSETAMRVKQRCHAVMDWCLAQNLISGNPTTVVSKLLPMMAKKNVRTEHQPSMPWQDLPAFVKTVLHDGTPGTCREAMEFLILSAARSGEVRKMRWDEIDLERKVWTVPAENMKAKIAHRVPLSPRMIEILNRQSSLGLHNKLAFPSPRGKVFSDNTLSKFLRDKKVSSNTQGRTAVVHGFRSSFRVWGAQKGYPENLLEQCLAHTERDAVVAAYMRADLLDERRPIMEAWADFVCQSKTVIDPNVP